MIRIHYWGIPPVFASSSLPKRIVPPPLSLCLLPMRQMKWMFRGMAPRLVGDRPSTTPLKSILLLMSIWGTRRTRTHSVRTDLLFWTLFDQRWMASHHPVGPWVSLCYDSVTFCCYVDWFLFFSVSVVYILFLDVVHSFVHVMITMISFIQ